MRTSFSLAEIFVNRLSFMVHFKSWVALYAISFTHFLSDTVALDLVKIFK